MTFFWPPCTRTYTQTHIHAHVCIHTHVFHTKVLLHVQKHAHINRDGSGGWSLWKLLQALSYYRNMESTHSPTTPVGSTSSPLYFQLAISMFFSQLSIVWDLTLVPVPTLCFYSKSLFIPLLLRHLLLCCYPTAQCPFCRGPDGIPSVLTDSYKHPTLKDMHTVHSAFITFDL